ncbi:MAG: tRNA (adenosine(37)-N6)-threonylcarbamoyltransferase complex transferase subunit TsaD, partial [Patescibacteria group bacterium]
MNILAIESSCDDCGVAIVKDGVGVITNLVASQEKIHEKFGGVVPEVASREHLRTIYPLVNLALKKAKMEISDIDALAVTTGPGLLGSLLVGVHAAKTLAWLWKKPLISVNHLQGHVYSGWLTGENVDFPVVALVASGGHTEIISMSKHGDYKYLGGTVDDAIGEAFDKTARRLGLGYPG